MVLFACVSFVFLCGMAPPRASGGDETGTFPELPKYHQQHFIGNLEGMCVLCHQTEKPVAPPQQQLTPAICQNCHDSQPANGGQGPGFSQNPKACFWCHGAFFRGDNGGGAHSVPQHRAHCTNCHNAQHNLDEPVRRVRCESCHTDRKTHQPQASNCQACHPFF